MKPKKPKEKKKLPRQSLDDGQKLADVAKKEAKMSSADMRATKKASDEEGAPAKPIPRANAKKWLNLIKRSGKAKKPFVDDADRYFRMYQGDYSERPNRKRNTDRMSVNIIYSHIEIVTPAVFSGQPVIRARPKPKAGESADVAELRARNMELVLNYWFKELATDEELHDAFFDWFFGPGVVELGWETEVEDYKELALGEDGQEEVEQPEVVVLKDRPFIMRRDFRNVYFDPDARRRRDCRWIAIEEVIPYNDFIASSQFTEKAKKYVKPQLYPMKEDDKSWMGRNENTSEKEWVQIFTIWDKEARKKYVVAECNYQGFLNTDDVGGEDWPYDIEYKSDPFPICVIDAKRDRMSPYSWSEFKAYEPQIYELNRIRQATQIHVSRTLPKYMYTQDLGDKNTVAKLMQARSDEGTKVDNLNAIKPLETAEIPKDMWNFNNMSKDDLLNVSGLFEYQNQSVADTATEASLIEGRSQVRKSMRSKLWEQFIVEIAAKLAMLCQQNMDESVAIEIAGPKGIEWLHVNKEQIQGEFFFDIEPGSMEYKNEALRRNQLLKFVELTKGDPNVNWRKIVGKLAKELDMNPEDVMVPQDQIPPPEPPEPTLKFKDIDPLSIQDPALMNSIVMAAARQNQVDIGAHVDKTVGIDRLASNSPIGRLLQAAMAPKDSAQGAAPGVQAAGGAVPAGGGKDISGNGMNPNGNPSLPPVAGNLNQGGNPAE